MGDRFNETDIASEPLVLVVDGGWALGLLEDSNCPLFDQDPHTRNTKSLGGACTGRAPSSWDKGGVHDNGWSCIRHQHVHPTWL